MVKYDLQVHDYFRGKASDEARCSRPRLLTSQYLCSVPSVFYISQQPVCILNVCILTFKVTSHLVTPRDLSAFVLASTILRVFFFDLDSVLLGLLGFQWHPGVGSGPAPPFPPAWPGADNKGAHFLQKNT